MESRFPLPMNTMLDGSYRILGVVGAGGFGITYEAEDRNLATTVAIKEYYPDEFGDRDERMSVRARSERHRKTFEWGRSNFLKEARTLARFEHSSIVRVSRVFEANSTAYMVMSFERGQSLESWLRGLGRPPAQEELDAILVPLLAALEVMHAADFLHRDIAPDNIIVRADGTPVLLDFGAARRAVAEMSRSLTGIVKAGYSPHEQYSSNNRLQGPWSDLYALGGTLYRAVTGHAPEEATLRVDDDRMAPAALAAKAGYRAQFLRGIDACLKVKQADRPQSVAQLRSILFAPEPDGVMDAEARGRSASAPSTSARRASSPVASRAPSRVAPRAPSRAAPRATSRVAARGPERSAARTWSLLGAAVVMIVGGVYGGYEFTRWRAPGEAAHARGKANEDAARRQKAKAQRVEKAPAAPGPGPAEPMRPPGRLIKMSAKLGSLPADANKAWLGVNTEPIEPPLAQALGLANANGALIFSKAPGGPADEVGMRAGDVILGIDGRSIANGCDLRQRLSLLAPGRLALVEVWRAASDESDFLELQRRLADAGDGQAMYRLGRIYAGGIGTPRDDAAAVRWLRRGADSGNRDAAAALGIALLEGRGVVKDPSGGVRLLRVAAGQDQIEAMNRLGHLLLDGKIAAKDLPAAARLFTKAAQLGHAPSMVAIARMYAHGNGVAADHGKALMWFKLAADLGNAAGMAGLGWLYQEGRGVEEDFGKAAMWYKRAADLGDTGAMADLALLHIRGKEIGRA